MGSWFKGYFAKSFLIDASNWKLSLRYLYSNSSYTLQSALSEEKNLHPLTSDLHLDQVGPGLVPEASPKKKYSKVWGTKFWRHTDYVDGQLIWGNVFLSHWPTGTHPKP